MSFYREIEPYIGALLIQMKETLSYRSDFVMQIFMRLGFPAITIAAWAAIYGTTNSSTIGGLSLMSMIEYFLVTTVVFIVFFNDALWDMQWLVQSGDISAVLLKPTRFPLNIFVGGTAVTAVYFATIGVPILAFTIWLFHTQMTVSAIAVFSVYMMISLLIGFFASFTLGCLAIYFIDIGGLGMAYNWVTVWFAGGVVPLSLFPSSISSVLMSLPWAYQGYIPVSVLTGKISVAAAVALMPIGIAWLLILFAMAFVAWRFTKRYMDVAGV